MSANGELFIDTLNEVANQKGLINDNEEILIPDWAYECWKDSDIPETGTLDIENDEGSILKVLKYKVRFITEPDNFGGNEITYQLEWIEINGARVNCLPVKDYIEYLNPIISDLKDGSTEPLTEDDVDYLMRILRAKISYSEGLITEEEYIYEMNVV